MPKRCDSRTDHKSLAHKDAQRRLIRAADALVKMSGGTIDRDRWEQIGFLLADLDLAHRDLSETL